MRTPARTARAVRQRTQPAGRIGPQPHVHRLTGNPEPAGHPGHARPVVQDLQHGPIALLHQSQLHQHRQPPPDGGSHTHQEEGDTRQGRTVSQEPGPLSPTYRGHVPKLSATYRGHGVHHEPGPHNRCDREGCQMAAGDPVLTVAGARG